MKVGVSKSKFMFRGRRIDNDKWIRGYYAYKIESDKHFILVETPSIHTTSYFTEFEVDPDSVVQEE